MTVRMQRLLVVRVLFLGILVVAISITYAMHARSRVKGMDLPPEVLSLLVDEWERERIECREMDLALDPGRITVVQAWEKFGDNHLIMFKSARGFGTAVIEEQDNVLTRWTGSGGTGFAQPGYSVSNALERSLLILWIHDLPQPTHILEVVFNDLSLEKEVAGQKHTIIAREVSAEPMPRVVAINRYTSDGKLIERWR